MRKGASQTGNVEVAGLRRVEVLESPVNAETGDWTPAMAKLPAAWRDALPLDGLAHDCPGCSSSLVGAFEPFGGDDDVAWAPIVLLAQLDRAGRTVIEGFCPDCAAKR
jgi:hypothetical protein